MSWTNEPSVELISTNNLSNLSGEYWSEFDVTSMVKQWTQGDINYGFEISTSENESGGYFYSSDYSKADKRPKLVIYYNK